MKRLLVLIAMLLLLVSCGQKETVPEETVPQEKDTVRLGLLNGPTGIGASYLLHLNSEDQALNKYETLVLSDPSDMAAQLISGEVDIAAVPSNLAASLYNKTEGKIRLLALNTAGVLYILENGDTVNDLADLEGKTIYATGQGANPEYVLNYLLKENGLTVGEDVFVEFMDSAELVTKMVSNEIDLCMLPVPAVTTVMMKNADVRIAVDLTEKWDELNNGSSLIMGCVVTSKDYYENHPQAVSTFLKEYAESIDYVNRNHDEAGTWCEEFEIVANAKIAAKAIENAHLIYIDGEDMKTMIDGYYQVLFNANPKSIGGALPDEDFYGN